jgi:hypothetical protein
MTPQKLFPRVRGVGVLLLLLTLSSCIGMMSRKGWNDPGDARRISELSFTPQEMAWLRQSTAVFFLPDLLLSQRTDFETAIARAWTLTPVKVVPWNDRSQYSDTEHFAYFTISNESSDLYFSTTGHPGTKTYWGTNTHIFLTLTREQPKEERSTAFCRIELHPHFQTLSSVADATDGLSSAEHALAAIYGSGRFWNFSPAQISLYLTSVQRDLERARRRWLYEDFEDEVALAKLKASTLYVPDNVLVKFDKFNGSESEHHDAVELLSDYPYPHQVVSSQELERILASATGPTYVFDYVKGSADKFVSIFERKSGVVYRHYTSSSYNVDSDDFDVF